jgi:hypothetical protein
MGMKSTDTARSIPLVAGPNTTAVIDRIRKLFIEVVTTAPANHFPERQHSFRSHLNSGARTFERGTHPPATPAAEAARLAAPATKSNPEALNRAHAHKTTTPIVRAAA